MSDTPVWKRDRKYQPPPVIEPAAPTVSKPEAIWDNPSAEARLMIVFTAGRKMNTVVDGNFDARKVKAIMVTALNILDGLIRQQDQAEAMAMAQQLAMQPLDGRN